jgi:hypothetical protein
MKIFSTASMAVLLLGASAALQSGTVKAEIDGCNQLAIECDEGNQEACHLYKIGCLGEAPAASILSGASSAKSHNKPDAILLNSKQSTSIAK